MLGGLAILAEILDGMTKVVRKMKADSTQSPGSSDAVVTFLSK
jgi:hypothetical protein